MTKTDDEQEVIAGLEENSLSKKRRRALLLKLQQVGTERSDRPPFDGPMVMRVLVWVVGPFAIYRRIRRVGARPALSVV